MNIEKYAKIAPQYYTGEVPRLLLNILQNNSFATILDCGCGDGSLLFGIKEKGLALASRIYAIDLSKNRISLVKKISPKIVAHVDSAETLKSIKTGSIELLISTQVIEHVNDRKMAASIKRVCKKGAIIYLSTVYKKWYGWYFYRNNIGWVLDPTHLREYSTDSQLLDILKNNFSVIVNNKTLQWFPVIDFIIKRIGWQVKERNNLLWKIIRSLRIPIFGYYNWEIVLVRK